MNYLQDRRNKKKKIGWLVLVLLLATLLIYFKTPVFNALSSFTHTVFRPAVVLGQKTGGGASNLALFFQSKKSLEMENDNLQAELLAVSAKLASYNSVLSENLALREVLGRKEAGEDLLLSSILSKPGASPYDTLVIDAGAENGVKTGDLVLALGFVPVGRVEETLSRTSKVILFSSPGVKTEIILTEKPARPDGRSGGNIFLEAVGRGGGNFEVVLPRDLEIPAGTEAMLPGTISGILGTVADTISDPRDAFKKVLLVSPVNVQELKFVQVKLR